jgi:hypothetical protein
METGQSVGVARNRLSVGSGSGTRHLHFRRHIREQRLAAAQLADSGTNAAAARAVFHGTGKRLRRLPIRLEDLLGRDQPPSEPSGRIL